MRVVIDSNRVQTEELSDFLKRSQANRAVVTDWLLMEAYKGDTLNSIYKSLGVLAQHPRQVVVLKNTGMCMQTKVGIQMANRLIWREHTETFPGFIDEVKSAQSGNALIEGSLLLRGEEATRRMQQLEEAADAILEHHKAILGSLSVDDVKTLRGREPGSAELVIRIISIAESLAGGLREAVGNTPKRQTGKHWHADFLFRVGLAMTASFLEWVRVGSPIFVKAEKVRNDYVDAMFSAYGTYFNGLMTNDVKLKDIDSLNRALLHLAGARLPPVYEL